MTSVNHLLRRLRAMLNFAKRKGWIMTNPFNQGEPLISDAAEIARNREEKEKELQNLLDACVEPRAHLRPIILIMTDTALRLTEAKRLTLAEVDFDAKVARVRARNAKNNKIRILPLSDRLIDELREWAKKAKKDGDRILPQGDNKRAWKKLKEEAGVSDDLQLRDLRGWGTTRIAAAIEAAKMPWQFGMKITGHTQERTYRRYLKTGEDVARRVGEAMKKKKENSD
jgi:integrase